PEEGLRARPPSHRSEFPELAPFRARSDRAWPRLPSSGSFSRELSQPPDELVERAFAALVAGKPDAAQDVGAREIGILAQPLLDPRLVQHQLGLSSETNAS